MSTYLPGTTGERIGDLLNKARESGLTKTRLAEQVGVSPSTITRIVNGDTQTVNDELLAKIAEVFGVSVDFLTGKTDFPDKKNYEIGELGLSSRAVENLYTRKVNVDVVNRLLENENFSALTRLISDYLADTYAEAYAAQNEMLDSMSKLLAGIGSKRPEMDGKVEDAVAEVERLKLPLYQLELMKIQAGFMGIVDELKISDSSKIEEIRIATRESMSNIMASLTKEQNAAIPKITPETVTDYVVNAAAVSEVPPEALEKLREGLNGFYQGLLNAPHSDTPDTPAK